MKQAYKLLTILLFFFVCVSNGNAQTLSKGSGTETDPYLIESESDWNTFASDVNGGYPYSGKYVKLVADISVSTMVGASTHPYDVGVIKPFAGTFDGNGKTLVIDIKDVEDAYIAPFRFLDGATIKNIKVTGTVDAATYKQGASLVGRTTGTVNLINCHCSATIQGGATDNGYGSHGGIVGESNGWISFNNCVFDGKIDAPEVHSCGGFIGWITSNSLAVTFENCLMAGTVNCKTTNTGTFYCTRSYSGTLTDCYYVESIGEEQGTKAFAAPAETGFSKTITFYDDQACYCHGTSSFDITELKATDDNNVSLAYTVKYDGTTLTKGTDYEEIITDGDGNIVDEITPLGKYTLTVKGKVTGNNGYYGTYETELSQPYAVLEDDGKTLVFKCGVKPNGAYDMNEGETEPACRPEWYNDGSNVNITKVVFDESFKDARPVSCYYWFSGCEKLTEIQNIQYFNTSEVTTMFVMFDLCTALTSIDLSHFDTRKVRNMGNMFKRLTLTTLDLSSFEMKNVKTDDMFKNSSNLTTIIVGSGWTKDQIPSSTNMFYNCTSLIGNDGTTYDASKVDKTNAHAEEGGYLTKGNYKIFYKWADDETGAYKTQYTPSTYNSSTTPLTINPPNDREGYEFQYWTRVSASGEQIGGSSATLTIEAGDIGNRIYKMHWALLQEYATYNDGTLTFAYGLRPTT
ncbi:MAG: BspA family leucine-rich repeat surface protein, partial [Bacteroidales bacterium]|nr:BspA family leucine-rich repeat surface protein [Bacteroidales bacterium]